LSRARRIGIAVFSFSLAASLSAGDAVQPSPTPVPEVPVAGPPGSAVAGAAAEEFERMENINRDLTVIRSRIDFLSEFTDRHGGSWSEKLTLGSTWGFHLPGIGPEHEWGVRLQAPLAVVDPGSGDAGPTEVGLGDVEMKAGWVFMPDPVNRFAIYGNSIFNTATDDLLGENRNDLSAAVVASHELFPRRFTLLLVAEYLGTAAHEKEASSRNALELSFKPILKIAGPLSGSFLYKDKLDFRADRHFALVEPGLSLLLLERRLGLTTSLEIPIEDESYNYVAKVGLIWFY